MTDRREIGSPQAPPVLLIVFRRPDLTRQLMDSIRQARPAKLYVACDGPRLGHTGDVEKVGAVRDVIREFSEELHPITLFQETNLGCGKGVSRAISWFFEHEEEGIILEDDCLPDPSFYRFCGEMLSRYRKTSNVMQVAGYNHISGRYDQGADYFFTHYGWQWGWATWRRAWNHFDLAMSSWPEFKQKGLHRGPTFYPERVKVFDDMYAGKCDTWDYQWHYAIASNSGLSVVPRFSLVRNIGFGVGATHCSEVKGEEPDRISVQAISFPLRHSKFVYADPKYDQMLKRAVLHRSPLAKIKSHVAAFLRR